MQRRKRLISVRCAAPEGQNSIITTQLPLCSVNAPQNRTCNRSVSSFGFRLASFCGRNRVAPGLETRKHNRKPDFKGRAVVLRCTPVSDYSHAVQFKRLMLGNVLNPEGSAESSTSARITAVLS